MSRRSMNCRPRAAGATDTQPKGRTIEYRNLGRTGVRVSPLCLGCMMFGGRTGPEDSYAIIDRALDAGINSIDTADVYDGEGAC